MYWCKKVRAASYIMKLKSYLIFLLYGICLGSQYKYLLMQDYKYEVF